MKQLSYFFFIAIIFMSLTCKRDSEVYSIYRQTNKQNFKNTRGGEAYTFAANDSVIVNADYFMKVMGRLRTYGNEIIQYGFCWHRSIQNPTIGIDTLMTKNGPRDPSPPAVNDTLTFTMVLTDLLPKTQYYIRSYIIIGDGSGNAVDTAYNPVILKKETEDAIDEWFVQEGEGIRPTGIRFDALAFNFGDTIFFGTGDQGKKNLLKDIQMYDPRTGSWSKYPKNLIAVELPLQPGTYKDELTNGIGFALAFKEKNGPQNVTLRYMYIGLGDYRGFDDRLDKTDRLLAFNLDDIDAPVRETSRYKGGIRSGAVCFVIGSRAYVGTGSNRAPTADWYVFDPDKDRINDPSDPGWKQINSPDDVPRVGSIAFSINGRGYFGLGMDDKDNFYNDFWQFTPADNPNNPEEGVWLRMKDFPGAKRTNASAFVIDDQGYVGTGDNYTPISPDGVVDMESDPPNFTGTMFHDVYRYDPFNDRWTQVRDYTLNKTDRTENPKKVTRGVGFSSPKKNFGYIGYGIVPTDIPDRAQRDLWEYRPYISNTK